MNCLKSNSFSKSQFSFSSKKNRPTSSNWQNKNNASESQHQPVELIENNKKINSLKNLLKYMDDIVFDSYDQELIYRRNQANKTVLVKFEDKDNFASILDHFDLSAIENIFLFQDHQFKLNTLIEFQNQDKMELFLNQQCRHFYDTSKYWPTTSRVLYYRKPLNLKTHSKKSLSNLGLGVRNSLINDFSSENIQKSYDLKCIESIENCDLQIKEFFNKNKIDEIGYRIRFFVASLIEEPICGLFKYAACLPFGSSMNKFGSKSSDLDLSLTLYNKHLYDSKHKLNNQLNFKFFFMTKKCENKATKKNDLFDYVEFLVNRMSRFTITQTIRNARVPIIKFDFELCPKLNCDISMSNQHMSYQMTKLLWTYNQLDERVAPFIFLIRYWAKNLGITTDVRPSPNITNFHIAMLALNFLIRLEDSFVLPFESIASKATEKDQAKFSDDDDQIDYVINNEKLSDLKTKVNNYNNKLELDQLLQSFFQYYSKFSHLSTKISLNKNLKANNMAKLVIENPFSIDVNTAVNVSNDQAKLFFKYCTQSNQIIQDLKLKKNRKSFDLIEFLNLIKQKRTINKMFFHDQMNL